MRSADWRSWSCSASVSTATRSRYSSTSSMWYPRNVWRNSTVRKLSRAAKGGCGLDMSPMLPTAVARFVDGRGPPDPCSDDLDDDLEGHEGHDDGQVDGHGPGPQRGDDPADGGQHRLGEPVEDPDHRDQRAAGLEGEPAQHRPGEEDDDVELQQVADDLDTADGSEQRRHDRPGVR